MNSIRLKDENEIMIFLDLITDAGSLMFINGGEVYRVEDMIERISKSVSDVEDIDVLATYSGIISSIRVRGKTYTRAKKLNSRINNFNKVDKVNSFSRKFVAGDFKSLKDARDELNNINNNFFIPIKRSIIGTSVGSAAFTAIINKNLLEIVVSFFVALLSVILTDIFARKNMGFFLNSFFSGLMVSIFALIFKGFLSAINVDSVIIGAMMSFVPGSSLTNSVRDLLNGDVLSGITGGITAILIGLGLAIGVILPMMLFNGRL